MAEPIKDTRLRIELEDREGVRHSLRGLFCNGKDYLKVREGSVDYSITFGSISSIEVLGQDPSGLRIRVNSREGTTKEYFLSPNTYCRASSKLGEAGFYLKDVKTIFIKVEEKAR